MRHPIVATSCQLVVFFCCSLFAEAPSFDVDDTEDTKSKDRTYIVESVDDLALNGITDQGAGDVANAVKAALKDKPEGTKVRVTVSIATEGSVRWTYFYPRAAVALDEQGRPHGTEMVAVNVVLTVGRIVVYREVPWVHGVRHGIEREYKKENMWKPEAQVIAEIPWKDGKMHGLRKGFYPDGKPESETQYVEGTANGPTRLWDQNGNLTSEGVMKDGQRDGQFTEYWPGTTQPSRIIHFKAGVTHGLVKEFYSNGKLKRERSFKDEAAHGEDRIYDEAGEVTHTRYWWDGDIVSKEEFEKRSKGTK
ncbi:MAG: toxin-antitoxin system YwqK family antitoxin [Planctomycetota bacterium]|nr:toxin-antitoxin system YwqK family antitoxin [Planctomycetota bacterium]MDA1141680.1 toxin-antitoxin system YwqK family antitoxin [Planctomycetota bacterium]